MISHYVTHLASERVALQVAIMQSLCSGGSAFATATVPLWRAHNEHLETGYQRLLYTFRGNNNNTPKVLNWFKPARFTTFQLARS